MNERRTGPIQGRRDLPTPASDPFASTIITLTVTAPAGQVNSGGQPSRVYAGLAPGPSPAAMPAHTAQDITRPLPSQGMTDDGIRPMRLAPSAVTQRDATNSTAAAGGDLATLDYMSGGGDPGPGPDAIMSITSGGGAVSDGNGGYVGVVGGMVMMTVRPGAGATIQSVTWKIDDAIKPQTYTWEKGETTPLPNPFGEPGPNPGTTLVNFTFYWDAITGDHTIDAQVHYVGWQTGQGRRIKIAT